MGQPAARGALQEAVEGWGKNRGECFISKDWNKLITEWRRRYEQYLLGKGSMWEINWKGLLQSVCSDIVRGRHTRGWEGVIRYFQKHLATVSVELLNSWDLPWSSNVWEQSLGNAKLQAPCPVCGSSLQGFQWSCNNFRRVRKAQFSSTVCIYGPLRTKWNCNPWWIHFITPRFSKVELPSSNRVLEDSQAGFWFPYLWEKLEPWRVQGSL